MNAIFLPDAPEWFNFVLKLNAQAFVLAAAVFAVLKLLGRWIPANWRALLWFFVIARVLVPWTPPSAFSLQNLWSGTTGLGSENARRIRVETFDPPTAGQKESNVAATTGSAAATSLEGLQFGRWLASIWLGVAGVLLSLLCARSFWIRKRLIRDGTPPARVVSEILEELGANYPIRVTCSSDLAAPALSGLLPARLIVPRAFGDGSFSEAQMRQILSHELAHLKQGHLLLHWVGLFARCLFWFNPMVHFAAARMRQECEFAADAAALEEATAEERVAYGETILQTLKHATGRSALALGMAENAWHIEQRLRALTAKTRSFPLFGWAAAAVLMLAGMTGAQTKKPTNEPLPAKPVIAETKESSEPENLFTRSFKVNPNDLLAAITDKEIPGAIAQKIRAFAIKAGVDFPTNAVSASLSALGQQGQKAIFYDDRRGILFIRATLADLDKIETALHVINAAPPQITFTCTIVEAPGEIASRLLNEVAEKRALTATNEVIMGGVKTTNTSAQLKISGSKQMLEKFPGPLASVTVPASGEEMQLHPRQSREIIKTLKETQGVEILSAPNVTTLVGRQARIGIEEAITVVTGDPGKATDQSTVISGQVGLGPTLDLIVQSFDGKKLTLTAISTRSEFLGYANGEDKTIPLPRFRVRQVQSTSEIVPGMTQLYVYDQEDLNIVHGENLRDVQVSKKANGKKRAMIFITPTLIDPAGNRLPVGVQME